MAIDGEGRRFLNSNLPLGFGPSNDERHRMSYASASPLGVCSLDGRSLFLHLQNFPSGDLSAAIFQSRRSLAVPQRFTKTATAKSERSHPRPGFSERQYTAEFPGREVQSMSYRGKSAESRINYRQL
jgi:hypothetical protein